MIAESVDRLEAPVTAEKSSAVEARWERRFPVRRTGAVWPVHLGSRERRSTVQLRRVRSDYAEKFFLGDSHTVAKQKPLSRIITF